ncbi:hypothetical protein G5I_13253 [Acromyrmex echinatior]|uniref:Uncharacterized protein n=1 Tax=Acromyrmex echinatior TaxID=103372 RepID=F4X4J0_ACREC|nr:hypothetical protein G5I_13253 [Acromyrmex echinatior]
MSMPTFVDLQRFIVNKKFIVKEVAVLKQGTVLTHYIFTNPVPWKFLTRSDSTEHRAVRLLRRYDLTNTGYKFLEIGINVGLPSRGRPWRSSRTRTIAVSRNVEEPLQTAREYLQDVSKRIQR